MAAVVTLMFVAGCGRKQRACMNIDKGSAVGASLRCQCQCQCRWIWELSGSVGSRLPRKQVAMSYVEVKERAWAEKLIFRRGPIAVWPCR
jgi:hypothetical protein